jgi:hypothetical protein
MSQKIFNNLLLSETFSAKTVSGTLTCKLLIIFYLFTLSFKYGIAACGTHTTDTFKCYSMTLSIRKIITVSERKIGSIVVLVNHCRKLSVQMKTTQCQCGNAGCSKHWEEVFIVEKGGRSVFLIRHVVLCLVHTSDNMYECIKAMWAKKSNENIFHQVVDVVDPAVVHTKGNLNVFPCHLKCICSMHCKCEMITITDIAMRGVCTYGRGIRRAPTVRQTLPKQ